MKAKLKSLLHSDLLINSGMIFSASFFGALFMFVSNLVLSRVFGPADFGMYKTVLGLFMFVPALVDFGASATLTKYIAEFLAKKEERKINYLVRFFFSVKVTASFVVGGLAYLFRSEIAVVFLKDASLAYLVLPGAVLAVFAVFELSKPVVTGFQKFKLLSVSNFLSAGAIGVASVVLGYYWGVYWAIVGWAVGYFIGNLINFKFMVDWGLFRKVERFDIMSVLRRYSLPMYGMYLLNMFNVVIIPVLSLFFAPVLIGYYGFAWTFYAGILLIPAALSRVLFPKISELIGRNDLRGAQNILKKIFLYYSIIVLVGIVGVLFLSEFVVMSVAPMYLPGLFIFKVLNITGLLLGYLFILNGYYNGTGQVKKSILSMVIYNVLLLIVSFWIM